MIGFIIRIIGNSLAIYAAHILIPGFIINGGTPQILIAGTLLGILNLTVKPVLRFISMPIIIITLGLFALVINAGLIWVVDYLFDFIVIENIYALIWATIVIGLVNLIISIFAKIID